MFTLKLILTSKLLDEIKTDLRRTLPEVKSSHRCEAIARGFGYNTYASLKAALNSNVDVHVEANGISFREYLKGKNFTCDARPFFIATARAAIVNVLTREVRLTVQGIGLVPENAKNQTSTEKALRDQKRFLAEQENLLSEPAIEEFLLSLAFLSRQSAQHTPTSSSYALKHRAERHPCTYPTGEHLGPSYVSNGAFIAAAIHDGFRYKVTESDGKPHINPMFNVALPPNQA